MRKPNPILLDILMRAGAYPFDDFSVQDHEAGVWVIPRLGSELILVVSIINNGTVVDPLVRELRRIARSTLYHHGYETPREHNAYRWTYEILYQCTETVGRVLDRQIRERTEQELAMMLNAYAFVPWFIPDEKYHGPRVFDGSHLPELIVPDMDDVMPDAFARGAAEGKVQWATEDMARRMRQDLDADFGPGDAYEGLAENIVGADFDFDEMFDEDDEEDDEGFEDEDEDFEDDEEDEDDEDDEEEDDEDDEEEDDEEDEDDEDDEEEDDEDDEDDEEEPPPPTRARPRVTRVKKGSEDPPAEQEVVESNPKRKGRRAVKGGDEEGK